MPPGSALASCREFRRQGLLIQEIFDSDPEPIGPTLRGLTVKDVAGLEAELKARQIEIVVIVVPAEAAQGVADRCVRAGIKAILNLAPVNLMLPDDVCLRTENMSMELEYLSCSLVNGPSPPGAPAGEDLT